MTTWLEPQDIHVPEALQTAVGGHPLVAQTLMRRGISTPQAARAFLDHRHYTSASPDELPGMGDAVERLSRALRQGEAICVWGDFDVDGQTATALLISVLRGLGGRVSYHIPVRAVESHGVNLPALKEIIDGGAQVLLTCDTGIGAAREAAYARQRGVDAVITDHHDLPPELPEAAAVVNPKLLPGKHPLASLPGVGVAYKLAEALIGARADVGAGPESLRPYAEPVVRYADLAALGIVADIAALRGEARYLTQLGLEALRRAERPAIQAILEFAGVQAAGLTEDHIGFELAPRLNALGRLSDANPAVELLTTPDLERARALALGLEGLNARRKLLTSQVLQGALAQLQQDPSLLEEAALVLAHPAWPAGVIGIVAGQLAQRYNRPVVLIATPPGEAGRGSARSVEGVDIHAAIAAQTDLLEGFGGHPMAAGLAIQPERIPEFRRRLGRTVATPLGERPVEPSLQIDGPLPLEELSLELAADLERLAPFGAGNPPLTLLCPDLRLASVAPLGKGEEHRLLTIEDSSGATYRAVWWQSADWPLPEGVFDLAYTTRTTAYRGARELQIEYIDSRLHPERAIQLSIQAEPLEVVDYRGEAHPLPVLQSLLAQEGEIQVWREGEATGKIEGRARGDLTSCPALAIWTSPPGPLELRQALEAAAPRKVYLFGVDPEAATPEAFLNRLAGLVKYTLRNAGGRASLRALAAAAAQREAAVRLGLEWLEASGHVRILERGRDQVLLAAGSGTPVQDASIPAAGLQRILAETAAYRAYFAKAEKDGLLNPSKGEE